MDSVDEELVTGLVRDHDMSDQEVSNYLTAHLGFSKGLSARSVKQWRLNRGLTRRQKVDDDAAACAVLGAVNDTGNQSGRRYVKGYIESKGGPVIGENRVGKLLRRMDSYSHGQRYREVRQSMNPVPYGAEYFGHRLHMDQNEKLVHFGVTHVLAIDGYSGFILGTITMPKKNNIVIYNDLFRPILENHGVWDQVIVDHGREFCLVLAVQQSMAPHRRNIHRLPFRQVPSKQNNRVERVWVEINERVNYPIKEALDGMVESGDLDMNNNIHKFRCAVTSGEIAQIGIQRLISKRNLHTIPKRGKPIKLMREKYACAPVEPGVIPSTEFAVTSYRAEGGHLSDPSDFYTNPFGAERPMQQFTDAMHQFPFTADEVYSFLANSQPSLFVMYLNHAIRMAQQAMGM